MKIDQARRVSVSPETPGLQRLFWSEETDLALAFLGDGLRAVYLGFDLSRSNFPLQAAFPLFIQHSLAWLRPRGSRFASTQIAAGETYAIEVPSGQAELIMRTPSGDGFIYEVDGDSLLFDATATSGIYRYTVGDVHRYFAVNLTDARESDINARARLPGTETLPARATAQSQLAIALWPYLAGMALVVLALEWCVWCARRGRA